jgi:hypothetical protein
MALLNPTQVNTDRFTWVPDDRLFVAEASDLPDMSRVFDDACDEGYCLVSQRTGKRVIVVVSDVKHDREGDLVYWELTPVAHYNRGLFKVHIYND